VIFFHYDSGLAILIISSNTTINKIDDWFLSFYLLEGASGVHEDGLDAVSHLDLALLVGG
jgi:hypothetical protein